MWDAAESGAVLYEPVGDDTMELLDRRLCRCESFLLVSEGEMDLRACGTSNEALAIVREKEKGWIR